MAKPDVETRPYQANDPPGLPVCGLGKGSQIDVHKPKPKPKPKPSERIELLTIPPKKSPHYRPELVWLAEQVNALLTDHGIPLVKMQRQLHNEPTVELTVSLERDGFYLSYARNATDDEISVIAHPG